MPFNKIREQEIPALQVIAEVYEDLATGAMHYHLASANKENVFLVAFPTIPDNSDGRAHILEHLALCGSKNFPVRDPFFSMTRRSMATFMNAMTYAEKTVYPFASQDRTDFFNLLDVYLDAAFFPNLDYLDFRQEGWRYAFENDKLVYQGVVFNEMKGAFTNPTRALVQALEAALYENTTYAVVSGGDPLEIPSLTHEDLKKFHATHYHPAQAVFMTFGDIPAEAIQAVIETRVLTKVNGRAEKMRPQKAGQFEAPRSIEVNVPSQSAKEDEYGIHFAWRLGDMTDTASRYRCELLASALVGDAAAPVQMAMESAGFGRPAGYNGVDTTMREMAFYLGMEGLHKDEIEKAKNLIWSTLENVSITGIPHGRLLSVLRDFEFQQQEVTGGRLPFGLKRLLEGLPVEMNGGNPLESWDNTVILEQLHKEIKDPDFIKKMVVELINNNNRVDAVVVPDKEFFAKRDELEYNRLRSVEASLTSDEKQQIIEDNNKLQARQLAPMSTECLPKIEISQIRKSPVPTLTFNKEGAENGRPYYKFEIASNSVSYLSLVYNMSAIEESEWQWLTLYSDSLAELGIGNMSFSEAEAWRSELAPTFRVSLDAETAYKPGTVFGINITFSTKAIARDTRNMCEMLRRSVTEARFDEHERIQFLIESSYDDAMQRVNENGNSYASTLVKKNFSVNGKFNHLVGGIAYLEFLGKVNELAQTKEGLKLIENKLVELHQRVLGSPLKVVVAATKQDIDYATAETNNLVSRLPRTVFTDTPETTNDDDSTTVQLALYGKSQVNHCYQAWPVPATDHPDASALVVLGSFLENGYLHRAIREEGGAYGASASYNGSSRAFTLSSYRDPRLTGTYKDFEGAIDWVLSSEHSKEALEEAIISTLQGMDKPSSPYGEALMAVKRDSIGMTDEIRAAFRKGVIECSIDDIRRVTNFWLLGKTSNRCAFLGIESHIPEAENLGLKVLKLEDINQV